MDEGRGVNFILGLLVGALVGASIAILMAPQTGTQTREQLKEKAEEIKKKAEKYGKDFKEDAEEWIEKGHHYFEDKVVKAVKEVKDAVQHKGCCDKSEGTAKEEPKIIDAD